MPIHEWSRVDPGLFHNFVQGWTVDLRRWLNQGALPNAHFAMIDMPPAATATESDSAYYARRRNRVSVRGPSDRTVAIIEIVSPGNKESKTAARSFSEQAAGFIRSGVHLIVIDLFPQTSSAPDGIHESIWREFAGGPVVARPALKPLMAAAYEASNPPSAYVEPLAVGDELPPLPLFLEPGYYVPMPLEETYRASWENTPAPIRDLVLPSAK